MAFVDSFLKQLATGDSIHDWQHASKIFVSDSYRLAPKYAWLFFVKVVINSTAGTNYSQTQETDRVLLGMTAKSAGLPRFTIDNKIMNAYNRPNIVQSKLKYDPVTIKFHDDSSGLVRAFWYDYLSYYYRDTDYVDAVYASPHKYQPRQRDGWGYNIKPDAGSPGNFSDNVSYRYIDSISIFSMSQKTFAEYKLINPTITQFQHGEHNVAEGGATLEHTMTFNYETVQYRKGYVTENTIPDMFTRYDRSSSPLTAVGGGTRSIFGPGGYVAALGEIGQNLADGNFLAAALAATRANERFKGADLGKLATAEATQVITNMVTETANPFSSISVPAGISAVALGAAFADSQNSNKQQGPATTYSPVTGTPSPATPRVQDTTPAQNTLASSNGSTVSVLTNSIPTTTPASFPTVQYGQGGTGTYVGPFVIPPEAYTEAKAAFNSSAQDFVNAARGTGVTLPTIDLATTPLDPYTRQFAQQLSTDPDTRTLFNQLFRNA